MGRPKTAARRRRIADQAWRQALDLLDELNHPDAATIRAKLCRR